MAPDSTSVLCIKISFPNNIIQADQVKKHLEESVKGEMVEFSDASIAKITDWSKVKKYYKLQSPLPTSEGKGSVQDVETEILGKMVLRVVG